MKANQMQKVLPAPHLRAPRARARVTLFCALATELAIFCSRGHGESEIEACAWYICQAKCQQETKNGVQ
eukprot:1083037-Rhodomonas_salina.1